MSYSRSFTKRVVVHYSGSVSYPASENGGSVSYSGTEYEDVTINVHVDTDAFDDSVGTCNTNVNLLTGAVSATELAQVESIRKNAHKVGHTIVSGFFKTVRSEISQQITELSNKIDATLMHMKELSKRCIDKQSQMEVDYNRIAKRYLQIFADLDSELKNRVYSLDRPVFLFRDESDKTSYRALSDDSIGIVAVSGTESRRAEAMISASLAKKQCLDTINIVNSFLLKQKLTNDILESCMLEDDSEGLMYEPVCLLETNGEGSRIDRKIYRSDSFAKLDDNVLMSGYAKADCTGMPISDMENIKKYFYSELAADMASDGSGSDNLDSHRRRVNEYLVKMFTDNNIKTY